jgi:hypothetical protein
MKKIWKKCFRQKNQLFLLLLLTVIQCKQRYIRKSLPCNVTVVDLIVIYLTRSCVTRTKKSPIYSRTS